MATPAKLWLPPLPVGLRVQVGNFTPAASKSVGQKGSRILDNMGGHSSGADGLCGVSSDAAGTSLGLCRG